MDRCETCVHWNKGFNTPHFINRDPIPDGDDNWGLCELIEQPEGKASVVAFTVDHEEYGSELITRANFGCTLHEEVDRDDDRQAHQEKDRG